MGMDPGFHRRDDNAGMTEWGESRLQVDRFRIPRNNKALTSYRWKTVSRLKGWGWTPVFTGVTEGCSISKALFTPGSFCR